MKRQSMYVQHSIGDFPYKHCYSGRAIIITY